ncbi:VWD domain-containing protein [Pyxidicoccus sp. 3LG]
MPGIIRYGHGSSVTDITYPRNIREPADPSWRCPSIGLRWGGAAGEPHILTFAGERYDFQAVGEFYALRMGSTDANEVQLRLEPYKSSESLSIVTGVALRCADRTLELAAGQGAIRVDGKDVTLIGEFKKAPAVIRALWSSIEMTGCPQGTIQVSRQGEFLNVMLEPREGLMKLHPDMTAAGILGTVGRAPQGLLALPNGSTVPLPRKPVGREHPLYQDFAKAWRVPPEKSLFSFPARNPLTRTDPTRFPVSVAEPSLVAGVSARERCSKEGVTAEPHLTHCAYDLAVTGDAAFVRSAAALSTPEPTPELQGTINLNQSVQGTITKFHAPHEYVIKLAPGTYRLVSESQPAVRWAILSSADRRRLAANLSRFKPMKTIHPFITGGAGEFRIILGMSSADGEGRYSFTVQPVK